MSLLSPGIPGELELASSFLVSISLDVSTLLDRDGLDRGGSSSTKSGRPSDYVCVYVTHS